MRSTALLPRLTRAAICGVAAALLAMAGCKTSTASSGAAGGSGADGGAMMDGDGGAMAGSDGGAAGSVARDVGRSAGTAAGNVASGVQSAGQGIADAGAAAYGAATSAASGAATTAADAARDAAASARAAIASADGGAPAGASPAGTPDAGAPGGGRLSDAEIAAVAVAANQVDIEAARAAKRKTRNARVKKFANDMIRDHGSANKQAAALVKKLGVTPEENDLSQAITQGGKDNLANLQSMKGKAFDRAYAEHEVAYHQQVLGALDEKLIPNAQNPELKSLLQSVRAVVAQHLDHAAALADSLSK